MKYEIISHFTKCFKNKREGSILFGHTANQTFATQRVATAPTTSAYFSVTGLGTILLLGLLFAAFRQSFFSIRKKMATFSSRQSSSNFMVERAFLRPDIEEI